MINCHARSYGLTLFGEAARQAPAQAEVRPTAPGHLASTCTLS